MVGAEDEGVVVASTDSVVSELPGSGSEDRHDWISHRTPYISAATRMIPTPMMIASRVNAD